MKLQKLVYLCHGYFLASTDRPLIRERFEAWQYGPVSPTLYQEFKNFGGDPITCMATEFCFEDGDDFNDFEFVTVPPVTNDIRAEKIISFVWKTYNKWSARELSALTHQSGWAWDKVTRKHPDERHIEISDRLIKRDFESLVTKNN